MTRSSCFVLFALRQLFSDLFFEDPRLVEQVGLSLARSAEEGDATGGREKQKSAVETFAKLLELVTLRHRLLESASETAHLAQLRQRRAVREPEGLQPSFICFLDYRNKTYFA